MNIDNEESILKKKAINIIIRSMKYNKKRIKDIIFHEQDYSKNVIRAFYILYNHDMKLKFRFYVHIILMLCKMKNNEFYKLYFCRTNNINNIDYIKTYIEQHSINKFSQFTKRDFKIISELMLKKDFELKNIRY